eukprot:UN05164
MLYKHKLKNLHYRFVSQALMTQKEFYRKLADSVMQDMRCGAGQEFKMAITLGEYCEMICPVRELVNGDTIVCDPWDANQRLIENDAFVNDFNVVDTKKDYEGKTRLPRSRERISELKEEKKLKNEQRIFWLKKDMLKVKDKMENEMKNEMDIENENDNENGVDVLLSNMDECKVFKWMRSYQASHFSGKEQEYEAAGLIKSEDNSINILENQNINKQ